MTRRALVAFTLACAGCEVSDDASDSAIDGGADGAEVSTPLPELIREAQFLLGGESFNWLLDVSRDGDDVAVLVGQWIPSYFPQLPSAFQGNGIVLLSHDRGDTWARIELPAREAFYEPWWVHVGPAGLFVVLVEDRTSVGPIYQVREVDTDSGAYGRTAELPAGPIHFAADAISTVRVTRTEGATRAHLDLASMTITTDTGTAPELWFAAPNEFVAGIAGTDGRAWGRLVYTRDERCLVTVAPGETPEGGAACIHRRDWPISGTTSQMTLGADAGFVHLYNERGRTLGRRFIEEPPSLGAEIDLGPGLLGWSEQFIRRRFAGLLLLHDGATGARLVSLDAGVAVDVPLAAWPCVDAEDCALDQREGLDYGALTAAVAFEDGRYGAFYMSGGRLFYARVMPGTGSAPSFEPPAEDSLAYAAPQTSPLPAETPLESACGRAVVCFPGASMTQCLRRFGAATESGLEDFLAAESCDAIGSLWREASVAWGEPCTPGCHDNVAVFSCGGPTLPRIARDCTELGTTCVPDGDGVNRATCGVVDTGACAQCDGEGRFTACDVPKSVIDCGSRGEVCVPANGCGVSTGCDVSLGSCNGFVLEHCASEGQYTMNRFDCARVGLPCASGSAACGVTSWITSQCVEGQAESCDGDLLVYCIGNALRFVDCAEMGATCVDGSCRPAE